MQTDTTSAKGAAQATATPTASPTASRDTAGADAGKAGPTHADSGHTDSGHAGPEDNAAKKGKPLGGAAAALLYDRQHRDLLFYLSIAIFLLELVVGVVALLYGVIHARPEIPGGPPRFQFPWLAYVLAAVLAPAALLLIVHFAGVGLFRSMRDPQQEAALNRDLPERLRKVYAIIQGAPTVVLLLGVLLLGVALFYLDGAVEALKLFGLAAAPALPWIAGGVIAAWCVAYVARVWLNYRTRKLQAEYDFRREVLERTGIVIVERGGMRLPEAGEQVRAIDIGPATALPPGGAEAADMEPDAAATADTPATDAAVATPVVTVEAVPAPESSPATPHPDAPSTGAPSAEGMPTDNAPAGRAASGGA